MKNISLVIAILVVAVGLLAGQCQAQQSLVTLFDGEPGDVRTMSVGSWGGADCVEATDVIFYGVMSIRLRTSNEFRGGRIDFVKPVDLSAAFDNQNAYVRFVVYSAGRSERSNVNVTDPRGGGRIPGMSGGPSSGGPSMNPSGSRGPSSGGPSGSMTGTSQDLGYSPITELRLILFFEEGTLVVDRQKVESYKQDEAGWSRFNVPLAKLKASGALAGYHLKRIVVCGNKPDVIYIGEVAVIEDDAPILIGAGDEFEIWKGNPIGLVANADGGAAALEYSWDFDASDGITEEATGPVAQHTYEENGDYTVTVTVRDVNGIKAPKKIEHIVHVVSG